MTTVRWTCYQQNTAMLQDSNTGHGHQTWLRHPPIHSWMHHYLPLFPESACSKSFLASLALLFRITSRCRTVHKQRKQGHKLLPRWDLRQKKSQRAALSDWQEAYCLKSLLRSFVAGQLWLWLPEAQRREFHAPNASPFLIFGNFHCRGFARKSKRRTRLLYLIWNSARRHLQTQAPNQPHSNQYVITQMINQTLLRTNPRETEED